jgi:hypothetical protein
VVELIKVLKLPIEFAEKIDPFVRTKFLELWNDVATNPSPFDSEIE